MTRYTQEELDAIFAEFARRTQDGARSQSTDAWFVYQEIFYALYYTGARVSDVLNLTWENVNFVFSTIRVRQIKTGREVHIRIPTPLKERLQSLANGQAEPKGAMFVNTSGGRILYSHRDRAIRETLKACGLKKKSPIHSFRHTAAMKLLAANVPVHEVAAQLGDTVETIVRTYVKPEAVTQVAVDRAFEPPRYRNVTEKMVKTAGFEAEQDSSEQSQSTQKPPLLQGL